MELLSRGRWIYWAGWGAARRVRKQCSPEGDTRDIYIYGNECKRVHGSCGRVAVGLGQRKKAWIALQDSGELFGDELWQERQLEMLNRTL